MPGNDERDPLDSWLHEQVRPLPPPTGTFELITRRARRRKLRKLAVTVASAAAVAAAAVAVPNVIALHVTPTSSVPANGLANGQAAPSGSGTERTNGSAEPSAASAPAAASPSTPGPAAALGGPVPANFQPASVTFVSPTVGWVIGQAGTPGTCANTDPYICTSIVRTDDAGKTWRGGPAPGTTGPDGAKGVSGLRFLDGVYGWAFGPELWATHDAGQTWQQVPTNGHRVIGLETAGNRAFAVWATCSGKPQPGIPGTALVGSAGCTSFTLMTTVAGSGRWSPVGTATTGLAPGAQPTVPTLAVTPTTGYLLASDGTLYSGPLNGAWQQAGKTVCGQLADPPAGLPHFRLLALVNSESPVLMCSESGGAQLYTSADGGADWVTQPTSAWSGVTMPAASFFSRPAAGTTSLAAAPDGTLVLAVNDAGELYVLPAGSSHWRQANVADAPGGGMVYVGMTTRSQGIALPGDVSLHEIWMTFDGGLTWAPRTPITPGN